MAKQLAVSTQGTKYCDRGREQDIEGTTSNLIIKTTYVAKPGRHEVQWLHQSLKTMYQPRPLHFVRNYKLCSIQWFFRIIEVKQCRSYKLKSKLLKSCVTVDADRVQAIFYSNSHKQRSLPYASVLTE